MTSEPAILSALEDHVWTITINRPERLNSLDPSSLEIIRNEFIRFRDTSEARVAIITGTGQKSFCTGADIKATLSSDTPFAQGVFEPDERSIREGNYIRGLDLGRLGIGKPIIAAINGYAYGGGLELAMACDIRLASTNATFALSEVRIGSIPAVGGIQRLMRTVPHSAALTMILTGDPVDAATASRIGLVSGVFEPAELMHEARRLADKIASNAPLAVKAALLLAKEGLDMAVPQAMLLEQFVWGALRDTEDRVEGRKAFAEKRQPTFRGR